LFGIEKIFHMTSRKGCYNMNILLQYPYHESQPFFFTC